MPLKTNEYNILKVHNQCGKRTSYNLKHLILVTAEQNNISLSLFNPKNLHMGV